MQSIERNIIAEDVKVCKSSDYLSFKFIKGNREVNRKKVDRIKGSIKEGTDYLKYNPILVDSGLQIIDGQHRFTVSKELERPIYYIVAPQFGIASVSTLNTNSSNWTNKEFMNWYVKRDYDNYKKLDWLCDTFKISISQGMLIVDYGSFSVNSERNAEIKNNFKDGKLELTYFDHAVEVCGLVDELREYFTNMDMALLRTLEKLYSSDEFDKEHFVKKARLKGEPIEKQTTVKNYILAIEQVYNYHSQKVTRLI